MHMLVVYEFHHVFKGQGLSSYERSFTIFKMVTRTSSELATQPRNELPSTSPFVGFVFFVWN